MIFYVYVTPTTRFVADIPETDDMFGIWEYALSRDLHAIVLTHEPTKREICNIHKSFAPHRVD